MTKSDPTRLRAIGLVPNHIAMINILPAIPEVEAHPPSLFTCRPRFAGSANQFHSHPLRMATTAMNSLNPNAVHVKRGYAGQSASSTTKP